VPPPPIRHLERAEAAASLGLCHEWLRNVTDLSKTFRHPSLRIAHSGGEIGESAEGS